MTQKTKRLIIAGTCVLILTGLMGCQSNAEKKAAAAPQQSPPAAHASQPAPALADVTPPAAPAATSTAPTPAPAPATPAEQPAPAALAAQPAPAPATDAAITLRCRYQPGAAETVHYSNEHTYKSWVEMPNQPVGQTSQRVTKINLILRREIESVAPDGSAIMKVTFQSVDISRDVDTSRQKKQDYYRTSAEKTESTWPDQPALAGVSYHIKINPDTTLAEIPDLDKLRQELKLSDSASNLVGVLLTEDRIRKVHQRDFVVAAPNAAVAKGQKFDKLFILPDSMIKAPAIQKNFELKSLESAGQNRIATIDITGLPAQSVPEGFPEPEKQTEMPAAMIKTSSDMQELNITGQAKFDPDSGRIINDNTATSCLLALFEENIMPKKNADSGAKKEYGVMFTKITVDQRFEVLP